MTRFLRSMTLLLLALTALGTRAQANAVGFWITRYPGGYSTYNFYQTGHNPATRTFTGRFTHTFVNNNGGATTWTGSYQDVEIIPGQQAVVHLNFDNGQRFNDLAHRISYGQLDLVNMGTGRIHTYVGY